MRLALLLPGECELGARVRALIPALRERVDLELFGAGELRLAALAPREHDRILAPIADEPACAPLVPRLRALGGTVWLQEWSLRRLAHALRPALARGGLAARLAAWREGGLAAARAPGGASPLNRSLVRFGDAFVVPDEDLRQRILVDRNAPTPIGVLSPGAEDPAAALVELLARLPGHRTNRRSLIATAIAAADRARATRGEERGG